MTEMTAAVSTGYLGANHTVRFVIMIVYGGVNCSIETRPAAIAIVLTGRQKQSSMTVRAMIGTGAMVV